jgi:hypothetical protein
MPPDNLAATEWRLHWTMLICPVVLISAFSRFPVKPRYTIYISVAADFSAIAAKIPRQGADPLLYISAKNVENFSEFFKFSESSADNAPFMPQRAGKIVHNEHFEAVKMTS